MRGSQSGLIRGPQDFWSGLCLSAFAGFMFWKARSLPFGNGIYMGDGAAPQMVAGALFLFGLVVLGRGLLRDGPRLGYYPWRGIFFIVGSVALFALAINMLAFVLTTFLAVLLGSFASRECRPTEALLWSAAVTGFCTLLFPVALKLPLPLWPAGLF